MSDDLKPCPFCGNDKYFLARGSDGEPYCGECGAQSGGLEWNTRTDIADALVAAVKVKPLVWEYHPAGTIAAPPTGHAYIIDTRMKGRCYSIKGFNPQREFGSLDEAKAAAQADYERRILDALEIPDDARAALDRMLKEEREKSLREAAEICANWESAAAAGLAILALIEKDAP